MNKFTQINTRTIDNTGSKTKTETNFETDATHFVHMRHSTEANGHTIASGDQPAMKKCLAEGVEWLIQNRGYVEVKAPIGKRPDHFVLTNHSEGKTLECWISTTRITKPG